ncbi:VIT domain-containing protein [uncultured Tenacibaculum sp.]|uniref:VIT domain-containing protein n=1 Tax=uncultured Tenacibaculum sp. TaxID=174713 RepID=UPI00263802C6|nr:VIT domain-containing protein [uncultured Tenacibaculum sp.]
MRLKFTLLIVFIIKLSFLFAQEVPVLKVDEKEILVKKLKVETSIVGDIAFTTYDMSFYNSNNRVLEGELIFPLGENQSVIRYALDINGSLREAVIVEKEKARVAFESTVRQRIDPGLLVKTKGNNYKTRVYPIPAKGYKRIVIGIQQKLILNNDSYFYKLPFKFKNKMESYDLNIQVLNLKGKPKIEKGILSSFIYNADKDVFQSKYKGKKVRIKEPTLIKIPLNPNKEKVIQEEDYFYCAKVLEDFDVKNALENNLTIFWDTSLSQKNKKLTSELELLGNYFKEVKHAKVKLVKFNFKGYQNTDFVVDRGNWKRLKNELEKSIFEGGTSYDFLTKYNDDSNVHIIFTNGLNTLDGTEIEFKKKTFVINSLRSANHSRLKWIAIKSGGDYINLKQESTQKALGKFKENKLQFLGTDLAEGSVEFYPQKGTRVGKNFSVLGKGLPKNKRLKIYLGTPNDTVKTISFNVNRKSKGKKYLAKIWAQRKLNYLEIEKEKYRKEIVDLSKKYQIISPFTSLLVLDRIQDYVTHEITPPKELLEEYNRLLSEKVNDKKERIQRLQNDLFDDYDDILEWYSKVHKEIERNDVAPLQAENSDMNVNVTVERTQSNTTNTRLGRGEDFIVRGVVSDESGPMPGVNIVIKGTSKGTETDFNGRFSISVKKGDVLVYSFIGVETEEKEIVNTDPHNIILKSGSVLEEVVVAAYATKSVSYTTASAVSSVSAEAIESNAVDEVTDDLQGSVAGVAIDDNKETIAVRGTSTISKTTSPLYVVNGVPVKGNPNLSQDKIASIYILKDEDGQQIYGTRGSNGVIVITTKEANKDDLDKAEEFEEMVQRKIELKGWNPDTPYLKTLDQFKNTDAAYQKYLELRDEYNTSPSFYIDVADFFKNRARLNIAIQVLSNVAEIELDNYELLRSLAYKFEEYNMYPSAIHMYEQIVKLRSEDIQSHRDLALAYEANGEYQKAIDLLYQIVNGELVENDEARRYKGIETVALFELNKIIKLHKDKLQINHIDKRFLKEVELDLKIVIDWNHNDTDIDLWVIDPNEEKCYYKHKRTKIGGLMSDDMTDGFGPEQFLLKKAIKGTYNVKVKYYSSSQQKISGPTSLKLTMYKNYGRANETKKVKVIRLDNVDDVIDIGNIVF